jgi:hypothetical protein
MRRIFGPKRDEVTGEWTKLHKEELRGLYSSKEDEVGGACSPNGGIKKCVQVIGGKARGKDTTRKTKT